MSGRDEEIWSKEPPSEPGYYWAYDPQYDKEIIVCRRAFEFFESVQWDFRLTPEQYAARGFRTGLRIPSPLELTAAAKRVEELDGAMGYLARLFKAHAPQCEPMDYPDGLVSQIDNCMAGMRDDIASMTSQLAALKAVGKKAKVLLGCFQAQCELLGLRASLLTDIKDCKEKLETATTTNGEGRDEG